MSRHDGVSCDSCLKSNFRGKRYKCLICYDYDLCATCYEAGAVSTRHLTDHPVQCILTRADFDIFYGGEALTAEQPQSFTCPYCAKMGYTEVTLQEHVTTEHADTAVEVVCPICASLPGGDPNHCTDDLAAHLTLEHRSPRDFDEPTGIRHVRRIPHPGRGVGGTRTRRATNMHFSSGGSSLTGLSPSGRETMDPIAELLSQLSSVRSRAAAAQSVSSQLQQLEMQLQSTRRQLEQIPRRQAEASKTTVTSTPPTNPENQGSGGSGKGSSANSQFLLSRCIDSVIENGDEEAKQEREGRNMFVQELLLSTLTEHLNLSGEDTTCVAENFGNVLEKLSAAVLPLSSWESEMTANDQPSVVEESAMACIPKGGGTGVGAQAQAIAPVLKSVVGQKPLEKMPQSEMKIKSTSIGLQVGRGGGVGGVSFGSQPIRGGMSRSGQGTIQVQASQNDWHNQPLHNVRSNPANNLSLNVAAIGGAGYDTENPQPLPGRPGSAGRDRDVRMNPPVAKRNLVKHLPATKTSDREPPPH